VLGRTATFTVVAKGTQPFTYQWKKNGAVILDATEQSYTTPPTTAADDGDNYRVSVSNSLGRVDSVEARLTVIIPPTISTQPQDKTINKGQNTTFTVSAKGTAPLTYQWQRNGVDIPGATANSYKTPPATLTDNGTTFRVKVTNSGGSITSSSVTLTVH
jgi:hypothetical protein